MISGAYYHKQAVLLKIPDCIEVFDELPLCVSFTLQGDFLTVAVEDYGPGVPEEKLPFLFQVITADGSEHTFCCTVAGRFDGELQGRILLAQMRDHSQSEVLAADYGSFLADETEGTGLLYDTVHYELIKRARTVTSDIGSLIVIAFSLIVSAIALIIIKFRIGNSIEEEMQNIGALKAMGYTGGQITASFWMQYFVIAVAGIAAGIAISYLLLPFLPGMFAAQTGIDWRQGFDPRAAAHRHHHPQLQKKSSAPFPFLSALCICSLG